MDDSDMEYLDLQGEEVEEDQGSSYENSDEDFIPHEAEDEDFILQEAEDEDFIPQEDEGVNPVGKKRGRPRSLNPKKERPLSETRPMKCNQCDAVLTGISSLNSHVKRMHLKEKRYPCHICGHAFFTTTHREDHVISVHTRRCTECDKDVIENTPWTEGMDKTTIRTVVCSCGNEVLVHSKTGRTKIRKEGEPRRRRAASEITPIDCEHCGLTLTGRSSLYAHIRRLHLNVRDFKCSVCGKEFFSSTHLHSHVLSVHTRKCQTCQEFVMETEPWPESMDKTQHREITCKCGTMVEIFTKRGPKFRSAVLNRKKPKPKQPQEASDTRYVCGSCGKIFLKRFNAMAHKCENVAKPATEDPVPDGKDEKFPNVNVASEESGSEFVLEPDPVQYKMEGGSLVIAEGSQVVMFEDGESVSGVPSFQIMHDGKLVPAEQTVDEHGNVSLIIKPVE